MRKPICYVARAMTGLVAADVVAQARLDKCFIESKGFKVLCPVSEEGVISAIHKIQATKDQMDTYWRRDKQMIEESDVLFNMSPHMASLGVIREHGYARFFLYRKVISVFPKGLLPKEGAVCYYEDDFVTDSLEDAAHEALRTHGTLFKRLKWRLCLYVRCIPKMIRCFFGGWK
jgi:hypothetical protein